jgi:uncharacterized protein YaiL (DUF2058 family)
MANSLQEQMLKLGLVDEKQVRTAESQKQGERRPKGQGRRDARGRKESKCSDHAKALSSARQEARKRQESGQTIDPELERRVEETVRMGRRKGQIDGRRRFYFDSRDGRVPYLDLSDEVIGELESGRAAIAESASGKTTIITAETAIAVMGLDVDWLRRWNA